MMEVDDAGFLPDFCAVRSIFVLVVSAELLAFLLVLAGLPARGGWEELGLTSLFVQWVALAAAAVLCVARPALQRLRPGWVVVLCLGLVLVLTGLGSLLAVELLPEWIEAGEGRLAFLGRNLAIAAIVSILVLRYLYLQEEWRRRLRSEARARIEALQARIRPHFLFNSLNTIASLIRIDADQAERALEDLAELFRASLQHGVDVVPLTDELALCRRYLEMEQLRLGERLRVEWRIEGVPDTARVPLLTLQPLVENAVYHGIEPLAGGGVMTIRGGLEQGRVCLWVSNPLPPAAAAPHHDGNRVARDNIRARLRALYGGAACLEAAEREGVYEVRLCWPLGGGS